MKLSHIFTIAFCLVVFSCTKEKTDGELTGTWKMILVTDDVTGIATPKPDSISRDVEITFRADNSFSGHTVSNDFDGNFVIAGADSLSVNYFSMTKVYEVLWGRYFTDNFPNAQTYSFRNDEVIVKSPGKTLTFQKE